MQAYRDNFKQTPCPSTFDQSSQPQSRLPFSKGNRSRSSAKNDHTTTGSINGAASVTTPRMLSPTPSEDMGTSALLRQNQELRQRLAEEANSYRRRLDTYKQAQQNQTTLVSRLQSKIQQYRQRCNDLEERMQETIKPPTPCPSAQPKITTGPTSSQVMVSGKIGKIFFSFLQYFVLFSLVFHIIDPGPFESTLFLIAGDTPITAHLRRGSGICGPRR